MKCPFCESFESQVKDSRPSEDGLSIRRRRICSNCGGRFTTFERIEMREISVIKRSGDKRSFDGAKLLKSISIASRKRNIPNEKLEDIVTRILKKLESHSDGEVTSELIGKLAMSELAEIDQVAYVRYASVYKDFSKASDFSKFISNLKRAND